MWNIKNEVESFTYNSIIELFALRPIKPNLLWVADFSVALSRGTHLSSVVSAEFLNKFKQSSTPGRATEIIINREEETDKLKRLRTLSTPSQKQQTTQKHFIEKHNYPG